MEKLLLILQITIEINQWSCKVCIIEKLNTRESKRKLGTLFKRQQSSRNDLSECGEILLFTKELKLTKNSNQEIIQLFLKKGLLSLHIKSKAVWVKSKITLDNRNPTYYIGCNYCDKKINCNEGIKFRCMFCDHANAISIKRYTLIVELFDGTDRIEATLFNRHVDKLFSLTKTENVNDGFDFHKLQKKLDTSTFAIEIRGHTQDLGGMTTAYTIASICEDISTSSFTGTKKKLAFGESSNPREDSTDLPSSNVENQYVKENVQDLSDVVIFLYEQ